MPNGPDERAPYSAAPPFQYAQPHNPQPHQPPYGAYGYPNYPAAPYPPAPQPNPYPAAAPAERQFRPHHAPRRSPPRYAALPRAFNAPDPAGTANRANPTGLWWLRGRGQPDARDRASSAAPNLAALDGQLSDLAMQIEALRAGPQAMPNAPRPQTLHTLEEIVAPLMQAVPVRAIEALDADVRLLSQRIEASRASGIDPRMLAPIAQGLSDVRAVLAQLKPMESLTAFKSAIRALAERLDQTRRGHGGGSAATQIETVIAALRDIAGLVAAKESLGALSEEVRGLSARLQRIATRSNDRPESVKPAQQEAPQDSQISAIERSLQDINKRLDELQKGVTPSGDRKAELPAEDRSAREALEAAHATLSQLIAQLAGNLQNAPNMQPGGGQEPMMNRPSLSGGLPHATGHLMDFASEDDADYFRARPRSAMPHPLDTAYFEPQPPRAIVIPVKPLIFGALVIILAVVAARVSMQLTDVPLPAIAKADASQIVEPQLSRPIATERVEAEVPDLVRSQAPDHATAAAEPRVDHSALAIGDQENTGTIGRPVSLPASSRDSASEPGMPLPTSLPAALRTEAMRGNPAAEYEVGVRLVEGKSTAVNTEEGMRWLKRAAKSGIIPAHLWIASLYEKGLGVEKDLNLARTHYMAAAEKGNAKAMHNLAVLYAEGIDGRRDYKTAVRWFQRAAERGIADSQYNLAILRMRGIGMDQNHQDAYKWFALAALQGDREAARHRDEIGRKLEPGALAAAQSAVRNFTPQPQPNEAVTVAAPAGGWDRATEQGRNKKSSQSGIFARGAS
jgi:predicted  nucleic acid-binding Zn-ribbon protein